MNGQVGILKWYLLYLLKIIIIIQIWHDNSVTRNKRERVTGQHWFLSMF